MKTQNATTLKLVGKVDRKVIKKLVSPSKIEMENSDWFFMDYSTYEIPVNNYFDMVLESSSESSSQTLISGKSKIKLTMVLDQFGNNLESVPKGFKTICRLKFISDIPKEIKKLPTLKTWIYNPSAISITNHENVRIYFNDIPTPELDKKTPSELKDLFLSTFRNDKDFAETILKDILSKGYIKPNENKELELMQDF